MSYVRNKAQPEGSIAEGYLVEEILTFCSRYFDDSLETRFNRSRHVDDAANDNILAPGLPNIFRQVGRAVGNAETFTLTQLERLQAHRYVLVNCKLVDQYIE